MPQIKILQEKQDMLSSITSTTSTEAVSLDGATTISAQAFAHVEAPSAAAVNAGVAASLVLEDITYAALLRGAQGNTYSIRYLNDTPGGPITVEVDTGNVTVHMDATPVTGSTADAIKAVLDVTAGFTALMSATVTGTGTDVQSAAAQTPLASGVESQVDIDNDSYEENDYEFATGAVGQWTTTGTLPSGLSLATNYYAIAVDANNFQVAASLEDALAGTPVTITSQGSSGAVHTFTPTALSGGSLVLQVSNDPDSEYGGWINVSAPASVTTDGLILLEKVDPTTKWARVTGTVTAGAFSTIITTVVKGPN